MNYQKELYKIKDQIIEWEQRRRDITMLALFEALIDFRDQMLYEEKIEFQHIKVREPMFGDIKITLIMPNNKALEVLSVEKLCFITYREIKDMVDWGPEKSIIVSPNDTILSLAERHINAQYNTKALKTILNDSLPQSENTQKKVAKKTKI